MSSATPPNSLDVDAMLSGAAAPLTELLRRQPATAPSLADDFRATWRQRCALHDDVLDVCEPLFAALAGLDAALWAAAPAHPVWRVLALVQQSSAGYQPELGRAGEKLLGELRAAVAQVESAGWPAAAAALENWWAQEQQRLGRLEQRLIDAERGQLRSRRAQQMAARLLNQTMAGRRFAREVVDYLQGEWFRELQWALLQFGADSEPWRRRAALTERLVDSLQPPEDEDDESRQKLYALIPDVGAELAALLDERAHDRNLLEQQLALIEAQHLLLLRGKEPAAAAFQLIANDDPWLSTTTVSASLLQRVAVLEAGSWFLLRDVDAQWRIKLALKLDDSTQLLFVNRLGVKSQQKSFEEFAYLLSVGAAAQLPADDCARTALRALLTELAQREVDDEHERAEVRRQIDEEARLRVEAKAKAMAEAKALAEAQARAEAEEAAQRELEEQRLREERELHERQREEQQRQLEEEQKLREQQYRLEEQQKLEQQQRELEEQRIREEQQRLLEERRRLEEAQQIEEQRLREQRELQEQQRREQAQREQQAAPVVPPAPIDEQKLRMARREAGLLPIGSWLELLESDGTARRLKVAVKLPSSGKVILVDRDGVRQAEFERDGLAILLCDGRARILNQGPKFEDTLAKVVDSMRRDRAPRE